MIPPFVRYILLIVACAIMAAAVIWIGRHMIRDISDMLDHDEEKAD